MPASDRYSACGSTLDEFIAALTDARKHGAPPHAIVKTYDAESGSDFNLEPVTGFVISSENNTIILYTDDDT